MYSFEGDFRRKPQQNLAGASAQRSTDRNALILQTQQQRQKREEHRRRLNSTIKIQAYVRSYMTRKYYKQIEREKFDSEFPQEDTDDDVFVSNLVARILYFYDDGQDVPRLISISQLLLKRWKRVFHSGGSAVQIRRLLALHLRLLRETSDLPLAVPLRMFEVFTSTVSLETALSPEDASTTIGHTLHYLVKRGYFSDLRNLMCRRTPPLLGPSANPPTPLCAALLELIMRPVHLVGKVPIPGYDDTVMTEFTASFLCTAYPEPVEMFVIPSIVQDANHRFPFLALVQCLQDDTKFAQRRLINDSWLLHSVLTLEPQQFVNEIRSLNSTKLPNNPYVLDYLKVVVKLTVNVCNKQINYEFEDSLYTQDTSADKDDDDSDTDSEPDLISLKEQMLLTRSIEMLNEPERCIMSACSQITDTDLSDEFLDSMSEICHNLLLSHRFALHKYRLLYTLAFKPVFLRGLWRFLSNMSHESSFGGTATPLLSALSRGMGSDYSVIGVHRLLAPLAVFCALFSLLIGTLHDTEFVRDTDFEGDEKMSVPQSPSATHAFSLSALGGLCRTLRQVCLGLVELACPERGASDSRATHAQPNKKPAWPHLFKVCTHLLRALYVRDSRLQFCSQRGSPANCGGCGGAGAAWTVPGAVPDGPQAVLILAGTHARPNPRLLRQDQYRSSQLEDGPPLTVKELRTVTILREIPFVVPFATRVQILQGLLNREKQESWYEMSNFNEGPMINISVRRSHLYEDAFDKLSPDNEPNMKLKLRVQLVNQAGADEAGVDGGGLFREFLSELLKSAFDPNRGLFRLTRDNMLYPNPGVHLLYDDFPMHYFFVGRMLGKAIYENLLVELPLAEFFLAKLCCRREPDVHALASLDPGLYRGLLLLKTHRRDDVPDLGLDFTIVSDELGEQRIDELKPGGANIPVTAENRIEYIHLVADYKLNRAIRAQCHAFKRGLTSVVSADWLRMFSCRELQLLIAGAETAVDINDLRAHTMYTGGFSDEHPTVKAFWKVVESFTDDQRRQLLKFVTSCSRPPLLGFKDLQPPFCIQNAGPSDRLPTSSTCMNLLKLPDFQSEAALAERLLYAVQAGAGFELS
ncbi:ubiquitin-protein ligase E3C [Plutella xylostella]|uniref:ubiquitin-protein ligase E3C n=1 Tax=Plutella xylostella TaxID=51655 RepID=UPI002032B6A8|nr:ubiquitin-protein ligase E3C [Plutella xylostella]